MTQLPPVSELLYTTLHYGKSPSQGSSAASHKASVSSSIHNQPLTLNPPSPSNITPRSSVSSLPSLINHNNLYPAPVIHRSNSLSGFSAPLPEKRTSITSDAQQPSVQSHVKHHISGLNNTSSYPTPPSSTTMDYSQYAHTSVLSKIVPQHAPHYHSYASAQPIPTAASLSSVSASTNHNHRLSVSSLNSPTYSSNSSNTSPVMQTTTSRTTPPPPVPPSVPSAPLAPQPPLTHIMNNHQHQVVHHHNQLASHPRAQSYQYPQQYVPGMNMQLYDPNMMIHPNYSYVTYLHPSTAYNGAGNNGAGPNLIPMGGIDSVNHALLNKRKIIKRRTRTGCLTCRKRRIKCDERKPFCSNCEKSKKVCCGYEDLSSLKKNKKRKN